MIPHKSENDNPTIGDFFAYKNVFVTGGTGFLGTVLIESILASGPNVGNIYVLVRDKYGSNAKARIQRMLSKPVSIYRYSCKYRQKLIKCSWPFFADI